MNVRSFLTTEGRHFLVAVQFLTRLPVPHLPDFEPAWLSRALAYFPAVGALVGAIAAGVLVAANQIWPQPVPALLAVAAALVLTGALHEDGLADTADGLGGGQTPAQRLAIMKDSRIGTYGVLALILVLALKVSCLALVPPMVGAAALFAAHAGARAAPVAAAYALSYAGESAAAKVAPLQPSLPRLSVALATGLAAFAVLPVGVAVLSLVCAGLAAAAMLALALRSIGGYTGDVLGAAEQVFEVTVLMVVAGTLIR